MSYLSIYLFIVSAFCLRSLFLPQSHEGISLYYVPEALLFTIYVLIYHYNQPVDDNKGRFAFICTDIQLTPNTNWKTILFLWLYSLTFLTNQLPVMCGSVLDSIFSSIDLFIFPSDSPPLIYLLRFYLENKLS